jgi:hypothetical protein
MAAGASHDASIKPGSERMSTYSPSALPAPSGIGDGGPSHRRGNIVAALIGGMLALFVLGCATPAAPRGSPLFKRVGDRESNAMPRQQAPVGRDIAGA